MSCMLAGSDGDILCFVFIAVILLVMKTLVSAICNNIEKLP